MAFFQIQDSPSVFINTDYIERFQFTEETEDIGTLTIHFISGEQMTFSGPQGHIAYGTLIDVLTEESQEEE
jgi:hypothetical protein